MSDANKIKWIYLSLKNGDFVTAKEFIEQEVKKDQYNAELLFAQLLCEYKIKTQEEFFSSVSNLRDKEKIDNILRYANKEFAEEFVDNWEALLMQLDNEEYYNAFLLYLAQYNSPKRDEFVTMAENKAVETMNDELIEKGRAYAENAEKELAEAEEKSEDAGDEKAEPEKEESAKPETEKKSGNQNNSKSKKKKK
jgi:hypothetical protein